MKFDNKMSRMKKTLLLVFSLCATLTAQSQTVNLTVTVNNVKSNKGIVNVCLFNQANGFPDKTNFAIKCGSINAAKGTMQIKIDGIMLGKYAISAHHDENKDGKFNTNFIGMPTEAAGASNGAKGRMGPPKFENAVLMIDKNTTEISITLDLH
jgi:uncharacterized protein (DUF2141 family)